MLLSQTITIHAHHTFEARELLLFSSLFDVHFHAREGEVACFIEILTEQVCGIDSATFGVATVSGMSLPKGDGDRVGADGWIQINGRFQLSTLAGDLDD